MRVPVQKTEASSAVAASPRGTPHFATVVVTVGYVFSTNLFTTDHSNTKHNLLCNVYVLMSHFRITIIIYFHGISVGIRVSTSERLPPDE